MLDNDEHVDGYIIDRELSQGGYATVYQARRTLNPGHVIALKVLGKDHHTPTEQAPLDREFEFARGLDHRHLVTVYDHGPFWMTMQFVDGGKSTRLDFPRRGAVLIDSGVAHAVVDDVGRRPKSLQASLPYRLTRRGVPRDRAAALLPAARASKQPHEVVD